MISTRFRALVLMLPLMAGPGIPQRLFPGGQAQEGAREGLQVYVSILPEAEFVERVGGQRVSVEVLVQPGQSPHSFEPTPRQMAGLAGADVYFRIGVEFENALMPRIESTMRELETVDLRRGIRLREIEPHADEAGEQHLQDDGNEFHEQKGLDPHLWMDPRNAAVVAATIRDTLIRLDPAGREAYEEGYRSYTAGLEALHARIGAILAPLKGETLFVYHPAFGYFADAYGLRQVAVETGGSEPSARQLARLIDTARAKGVRVLFVQPQFASTRAEAVAKAIGGAVVPIDALARDYTTNLQRIADAVEEALRQ
jgi:zinc transport system substrate-binding protein